MGRVKDVAQDWLSDYGYNLGYDWDNLPKSVNWNKIINNQITAKEYYNGK
tara:strand:- start:3327 stop:3476 length:150 start_codon:yes stop_codon:yes gene_type:complete